MKRILPFLLAALLLWGCSADPQPTVPATEPAATTVTEASAPTPVGFYDPNSALESQTGGVLHLLAKGDGFIEGCEEFVDLTAVKAVGTQIGQVARAGGGIVSTPVAE